MAGAPKTVMVASLQASSDIGDVAGNTAKFTTLAEEAAGNGAKFLVIPETAITGYLSQDLLTNWHVPEDGRPNHHFPRGKHPAEFAEVAKTGPSCRHFAALAAKLQCYITVPFLEVAEEAAGPDTNLVLPKNPQVQAVTAGAEQKSQLVAETGEEKEVPKVRYFNTVCLAAPNGEIVAHYRKTSPWPTPEQSWASKGKNPAFYDTEYGRVGLAICFDIHSVLALYAPHQIWTLLYPIAWVGNPVDWYRKKLPTLLRKVNCPHYIAGCNWSTDKAVEWEGNGISTHFAPKGELMGSTNEQLGSTIVYSTFWTESALKARGHRFDSLDLKRYAEWTNNNGGEAKSWKW